MPAWLAALAFGPIYWGMWKKFRGATGDSAKDSETKSHGVTNFVLFANLLRYRAWAIPTFCLDNPDCWWIVLPRDIAAQVATLIIFQRFVPNPSRHQKLAFVVGLVMVELAFWLTLVGFKHELAELLDWWNALVCCLFGILVYAQCRQIKYYLKHGIKVSDLPLELAYAANYILWLGYGLYSGNTLMVWSYCVPVPVQLILVWVVGCIFYRSRASNGRVGTIVPAPERLD